MTMEYKINTKLPAIPPLPAPTGSVSVVRNLDVSTAKAWLSRAAVMGIRWDALGPVGNGRLRGYRFTAPIDRLFDFGQLTAMSSNAPPELQPPRQDSRTTPDYRDGC